MKLESKVLSLAPFPKRARRKVAMFSIVFENDYFMRGDIICPNKHWFHCEITSAPVKHGRGYKYVCQLLCCDFKFGNPFKFFKAGARWSMMGQTYKEGTDDNRGSRMYIFDWL